jgi:hypothetical protein
MSNFGLLKQLGYWLSRLSANALFINKKEKEKEQLFGYWLFANKMCLPSIYYSKFECSNS